MKKIRKRMLHTGIVLVSLFLLAGLPVLLFYPDLPVKKGAADAVTSASIVLPDQPSGEYYVLLRTDRHREELDKWVDFFTDAEELPVIFDDISCLVAKGDAGGRQLAERFQLQLPENQMTLREENPSLLVSKAEAGMIDVAVFSREMADALGFLPERLDGSLTLVEVEGGN